MFIHFKKSSKILFRAIYFLFLFINLSSCKKLDFSSQQKVVDRERFFRLPENAPEVLERIVLNMKMQDARKPFVENFIKNQGYPNWQFAKISISKTSNNSIETTSDTIVSVPIVQNGRLYLKSVLAVKVNEDVWYKLLEGIKYRELPNEQPGTIFTAGDFLKLMIEMEFKVFGQNEFKIIDTGVVLNLTSTGGVSIPNYGVQLQFLNGCTIFNYGYYTSSGFIIQSSESLCLSGSGGLSVLVYTLEAPDTGGGGGGGGGGGNPTTNEECERGFVGIIGFNTLGTPLIPCPIISDPWDSIPRIISQKCSNQMDSLYQWGLQNDFREQSFIVVKKNDSIYAKNFLPGFNSGDKTDVKYSLEPGEILLAYGHTHAEDTTLYYRTSFSAEDLIEFNKNANTVGYTAILEVGNARYAFVLENIDLKTTFNVSKRGNHKKLFKAVVNSLMNQFPNGQTCTEQAWINYLGSASACGIGFYKSTAPDKNTFIKLN